MRTRQATLFDSDRVSLERSVELTAQSLNAYGASYDHWAIAFSGGKDSATVVSVVCWLIESGRVKAPQSLTVLMSDTRMELPPLFLTAMDRDRSETKSPKRIVAVDGAKEIVVWERKAPRSKGSPSSSSAGGAK